MNFTEIYYNNLNHINNIYYTFNNLFIFVILYRFYYYVLNIFLSYNKKYNQLDINKKKYIQKNVIKSIILFTLVLKYDFIIDFYNNNLNKKTVKYLGSIYVANDLLGLLFVNNLHKSTIIHHLSTITFLIVISLADNYNHIVYKLIFLYTIFSYYAFSVNLYLGIRFLKDNNIYINRLIDNIGRFSYYNYLICFIINILLHIKLLIEYYTLDLFLLGYLFVVTAIINDDIILLKWLKKIE